MRTKLITVTSRDDIADTRQYMFNGSRMINLTSLGASTTGFALVDNSSKTRYECATALATLAADIANYSKGYKVTLTTFSINDIVGSKSIVLEVDRIVMAYAWPANTAYSVIIYADDSSLRGQRIVVTTTLANLNIACNIASGGSTAGSGARAYAKTAAVADTPLAIVLLDPATGDPVTMSSVDYVILVQGYDDDGPVDVQVTLVTVTGFTVTAAADCTIYYAVFE